MSERVPREYIASTYKPILGERLGNMMTVTLREHIEQYYEELVAMMSWTASEVIPTSRYRSYLKPYWKKGLKEVHSNMLLARRKWVESGRPRGVEHESYRLYKEAKRNFSLKHRQLQMENKRDFYQELDDLAEVDQNKFWTILNRKK